MCAKSDAKNTDLIIRFCDDVIDIWFIPFPHVLYITSIDPKISVNNQKSNVDLPLVVIV